MTSTGWPGTRSAATSIGLRAAIVTIERRLAEPTFDTLTPEQRRHRRKAKLPKGYPTQAERFAKQRRVQALQRRVRRASPRICRTGGCMSSKAANGWPTPATISTPAGLTVARVAAEVGLRPVAASRRTVLGRAVRQPDHHRHPGRRVQPAATKTVGAPGQCPTWPLRPVGCRGVRLPRRRVAGADHRRQIDRPTPSPAGPAGPAVTSPPPGPPRVEAISVA